MFNNTDLNNITLIILSKVMGCCLNKKKQREEEIYINPDVEEPRLNIHHYFLTDDDDRQDKFFFRPIPENVVIF